MQARTASPGYRRRIARGLVGVVLLGYPVAIYFAHGHLSPSQLLAGLLGLLSVRSLVSAWALRRRVAQQTGLAVVLALAAVVVLAQFGHVRMSWLRFYPMLLDLGVTGLFFGSLFTARPLVERIARVLYPDLPPSGVRYTRRVTQIWGGMMLVITLVSLGTALVGSLRVWSLFNGLIVYVVIALTFACEYAVRCRVKHQWETA